MTKLLAAKPQPEQLAHFVCNHHQFGRWETAAGLDGADCAIAARSAQDCHFSIRALGISFGKLHKPDRMAAELC
ncbi:MAG: hypothetical protein AAGC96_03710 [Pseudomonadota bacterium]